MNQYTRHSFEETQPFFSEIEQAYNTSTEEDVLRHLAESENEYVRQAVAQNPRTPIDVLLVLSRGPLVYDALCSNPSYRELALSSNTPSYILEEMTQYGGEHIFSLVAQNPNCPPNILSDLAESDCYYIRDYVAMNRNTPPEALALLAQDEEVCIRNLVASNPNCPTEVLEQLALYDEDEAVCREAMIFRGVKSNQRYFSSCSDNLDWETKTKFQIASNPKSSPSLLVSLATDKEVFVREAVAKNPSTPPTVLVSLVTDYAWIIRQAVAQNTQTPPSALKQLTEDKNEWIGLYAQRSLSNRLAPKEQPTSHHIAHSEPVKEKKLTPKQDAELVQKATSGVRTTAQNHGLRK